jgi:EAL domain-containing protein (putative c-di-GMP-specific phosphodiesterase class I)
MTVNLSLAQLKNGREFIQDTLRTVAKRGVSLSDFEFDVTEASIAYLTWSQNDVLSQLCRLGAKIAIDNFGTEYSSFEYLRSYRVNHLKIARSLVATAIGNPERAAMIRVMVNMARDLGIGVIAEGVETEAQRTLFTTHGSPTNAQGFFFSEPVEASRAREFLVKGYIRPIVTAKKAATVALLPPKMVAG